MTNKQEKLNNEIKEQLLFVQWLKDKGLYNIMDSNIVMIKMLAVWKAALA